MTISIQQIAPLGQITWTEGIEETTKKNEKFRQEIVSFLTKHINHDWGSLTSKDDAAMNDRAVKKAVEIPTIVAAYPKLLPLK